MGPTYLKKCKYKTPTKQCDGEWGPLISSNVNTKPAYINNTRINRTYVFHCKHRPSMVAIPDWTHTKPNVVVHDSAKVEAILSEKQRNKQTTHCPKKLPSKSIILGDSATFFHETYKFFKK